MSAVFCLPVIRHTRLCLFILATLLVSHAYARAEQISLKLNNVDANAAYHRIFLRTDGQNYDYSKWVYQGSQSEITSEITIDNLMPGVVYHFCARSYATDLQSIDSNEVTFTAPVTAPAEPVRVWLEAEGGALSSPMQIESGVGNCSGDYILAPDGSGNNSDPNGFSGGAEIHFSVPAAGYYKIWGRVLSPIGNDNSFWISVDGGDPMLWDTVRTEQWMWDAISGRNIADPAIFHLTAGQHTLVVNHREDGAGLDKLLVTNVLDYVPQGVGDPEVAPLIIPVDSDQDGIDDQDEIDLYGTDPNLADTDGDGISDGEELGFWGDDWGSDGDSDGIINLLDLDSDNDGITDGQELADGTDPITPVIPEIVDLETVKIWLEAEDADISYPMQIENGVGTCSGEYVMAPDGSGSNFDPNGPSGSAELHFSVPVDGNYRIWGRVLSPIGNDNSFWISVDGGESMLWDTVRTEQWMWDAISGRNIADPAIFQLTAGQHTLVVNHREDGAGLDKLLITNVLDYAPEGIGEPVETPVVEPIDSDQDGIDDQDEIDLYGTDPNLADTDGDGISDGEELEFWGDDWGSDGDSDGIINLLDLDSDDDGVTDGQELADGTDPITPVIPEIVDQESVKIWLEAEDASLTSPMQIESGIDDCAGDYIMAPDGSGNNSDPQSLSGGAEFSFSVPVEGNYLIWGRVLSPNGNDNSFWISLDGGMPMLWDTERTKEWLWDPVSGRNIADPVVFYLRAGHHTLVVNHREDGAGLDRLLITNDMDFEPQDKGEPVTGEVKLWLEAESANLMTPIQIQSDLGSSSGAYVIAPDGSGNNFDSGSYTGSAEFSFSVPVAGNYKIWGRVLSPNGNDNSFWISVDGGEPLLWDTVRTNEWLWDPVSGRNIADPVVFNLTAGQHTLVVNHREDGAGLDKLLITNVLSFVPEDAGEPAPGMVKLMVEAEDADLSAPMQIEPSVGDCSGDYIMAPDGSGNNSDPQSLSGGAEFSFSVPVEGNYKIWGRVLSPIGNDNSFWISVDGGEPMLWDTLRTTEWLWDPVSGRNIADPAVFHLSAGQHTLMVNHREDGAGLDKLLITNVLGHTPE